MVAQPLHTQLSDDAVGRVRRAGRSRLAGSGRNRTVESMASRVTRPCQRPDCPAPARAGVHLNHPQRFAVLVDLPGERDPRVMELCGDHAQRATVPLGWKLHDERVVDAESAAPSGPPTVTELRSPSTVETLAAALHGLDEPVPGVPGPVPEVPGPAPVEVPETVATMAELLDRVTDAEGKVADDDEPPVSDELEAPTNPAAVTRVLGEQPELPLELRLPRPVPGASRR